MPGSKPGQVGSVVDWPSERLIERRREALRLRRSGKSYEEIAKILGVSYTVVHADVTNEIRKRRQEMKEEVEEVHELETMRLDFMTEKLMERIENGDMDAVEMLLKVMNRRAKLEGLDAPTRREVDINDSRRDPRKLSMSETWDRIRELRRRLEEKGLQLEAQPVHEGELVTDPNASHE